jgi:hypothetical protein
MTEIPTDELRALLAGPPDRFVAARNERVRALRADGLREEAALLATVRKPNLLTTRVSALVRTCPDAAAGAVQAAEDMEAAQAGDGDLREAMGALRPAIDAVLATATAADRVDLAVPLRTVLADADAREAWLDGVLVELPAHGAPPSPAATGRHLTLVSTGPDATAASTSMGRRSKRGADANDAHRAAEQLATEQQAAEQEAAEQQAAEQRAAEEREAARRALQAKLDEAEVAVVHAQRDRDHATAAHAEAEDRLAEARHILDDATDVVAATRADVTEAELRLAAVRQTAQQAQRALDPPDPGRACRR